MALFEAVGEGNAARVRELLEANAEVDATDEGGFTALHHAVKRNDMEILKVLCEHRADVNKLTSLRRFRSPLYLAVEAGHLNIVKFLVQRRAQVDQPTDSDQWYKEKGETPLHRAAYKGRLDIVQFLVNEGASINKADGDGWTPLHCASYLGRHDITEFLIEAGANVNEQDSEGLTPLNCASERGNVDIISFLCQKGADVQDKDKDGLTPLHHASERGHLMTVKYLLENGANVNQTDPDGGTPLQYACLWGHLKTAAHLIEKGADVNMGDKDGETAIHHGARKGNLEILKILLDNGAEVNKQTGDGSTPVHVACTMGNFDAVRYFLRNGAKLDVKNDKGETPLDCAGDDQMRKILQRFKKDGVILEDDEVQNEDAENDEFGGEPSLEELCEVAKTVQKVSEFWRLFKELDMDDATIASALPIRGTYKAARQILQTWSDNAPGKFSEKKKVLKKVSGYELLSSTKGMSYGDILDDASRRIGLHSLTQFIDISSKLGFSAIDVMMEIDTTSSVAEIEKLFDSCVVLLSEWVKEGGQREALLQALQALHFTAPAEAVSTAIQEQPDLAENFSFSAIDQEGGDIQVGEGDVQIALPPGSLPDDKCEVVTIKVPEHLPEVPQNMVEEEEIQTSPPVQCGPSGLKFKKPVKITVPHCTSLDKITAETEVILYTKDDKGNFERKVLKSKDYKIKKEVVVVSVNHFSSFFVSMKKLAGFKVGLLPFHPVKMPLTRKPLLEVYVYQMYKRNEKKICNIYKKLKRNYKRASEAYQLSIEEENQDITIICPSSTGDKEKKIRYSNIKGKKSNKVTFELDFSTEVFGTKNIELKWKQGSRQEESQWIEATLEDSEEQLLEFQRLQQLLHSQRLKQLEQSQQLQQLQHLQQLQQLQQSEQLQRVNSISEEYEVPPEFNSLFLDVSDNVPSDRVGRLGVCLMLRNVPIRRFEDTNRMGAVINSNGTFYMLCNWYKSEMTKEEPSIRKTLREALISAELTEVAEEFLPLYKEDEDHVVKSKKESLDTMDKDQRPQYARADSYNELAHRPLWASMAGTVNKKYRGNYSLTRHARAVSKK